MSLPVPQRRQRQDQALQPVEQVLAELAAADLLLQAAARGAHQPDIDFDRGFRAARQYLALFQHVQELRLQLERQVADVIEEERAAVGLYDSAALVFRRGC